MRNPGILLALLLPTLAGCLGGDGSRPGDVAVCAANASCPTLPGVELDGLTNATGPDPVTVDVAFDGHTDRDVWVCELAVTSACHVPEIEDGETDLFVEGHGGSNLTGGKLTLTWTPASAQTEVLALVVMTMTQGCAECHRAHLAQASGRSPLVLEVPAANFTLEPEEVVHVYVYTYQGVLTPVLYVGAFPVAQPFHVEGSLAFQAPVAE